MDGRRLTPTATRGAVWITRAAPGAARTAQAVAALGFTPVVEPLVTVRPLPASLPDLADVAALAFTSATGVRVFAALHPGRNLPVFTVGAATAEAARASGWARVASADGDVAALNALLAAEAPPGRVLAPGARRPAGELTCAERLAIYETAPAPGPWPQAQVLLARGALRAVLIHAPSAARALRATGFASRATEALALSPACAAALQARAWGAVRIAARPDGAALLALLGARDEAAPWQPPSAPL